MKNKICAYGLFAVMSVFFLLSVTGCSDGQSSAPKVKFHSSGFAMSHAQPMLGAHKVVTEMIAYLGKGNPDTRTLDEMQDKLIIRIRDGAIDTFMTENALHPFNRLVYKGMKSENHDSAGLIQLISAFRDTYLLDEHWLSGPELNARLRSRVDEMLASYYSGYEIARTVRDQKERERWVTEKKARMFGLTMDEIREYRRRGGKE
ncbi:hypothetical protein ACFL6Y_02950 [Elusimicrobiota bacterium]